ncbi:cuticle protein 21.3 isoform X1 [Drosophila virilis]|uniref:cuticle protein 21.3 isoform X1 n=1 Tax=Drosophila virilis TaxID=7244 RepID=UPI00017D5CD2|nr:cuticle protein 16.5 isoform X1 [Drosophila virilis]
MAFKLIFCLAAIAIACAQAKPGGPAAYSISAPSVDHASVGNTQEHTVKGHYGQSSQSDYASQVQTAHSQSHVQRSSISNDGGLAPAHYAAAPQVASYALGHTAPAAQIQLTSGHAALGQGLAYGGHYAAAAAAPTLAYGGHYAAAAPALAYGGHYAATAPALQLSGASHLGYGYGYSAAAPAFSHGYLAAAAPAPVVKYAAAAPAYAPGIIGHGIGLAAPAYAAPAYATHLAAGPVLKAAVAAPALVHTSVSGHGIQYGY